MAKKEVKMTSVSQAPASADAEMKSMLARTVRALNGTIARAEKAGVKVEVTVTENVVDVMVGR